MRIKSLAMLCLLAALLLATLGWLALRCGGQGYWRLLLARSTEGAFLNPQQVEDFCAEEFLVTYEISRTAGAEAHNYRQPVTLIGTNSCYAQVLGYRLLSGGFFTGAAWQAQTLETTLNAAAAFALFGSNQVTGQLLKLDGQSWLVTGVIDDGDTENPRVYTPASVMGGQIDSLLALLDDSMVSADYAKNALKQLGVYESNYTIINLATAASTFGQRFGVAWRAACILAIALLLGRGWGRLKRRFPLYQEQLKRLYLAELITEHRADIAKTALMAAALLGGLAALLTLALQILAICLNWPGLLPAGHDWAMSSFAAKLAWLHGWQPFGIAIFTLYMVLLVFIFFFGLRRKLI